MTRDFAPTLELALRLHPTTEHVVVVSGGSEIDLKLLETAKKRFQPSDGRVSIRCWTAPPMQELLKELSQLPPRTIVLYTTFFRDGTGQAFVPHEVVERVSKAASVPVYGFIDQYVGRGLVGGDVYSFAEHGEQYIDAGSLLRRVRIAGREPVITVRSDPEPVLLPAAIELASYRIGVEATANALRHSTATEVTIDLTCTSSLMEIRVHDNAAELGDWKMGVGLRSIRDRAELLGGRFSAGPAAHGGTVEVAIPIHEIVSQDA